MPFSQGVGGVSASRLHVDKEQILAVFLQRGPHVFRLAGPRVEVAAGQHAAHLVGEVHFVGDEHRPDCHLR